MEIYLCHMVMFRVIEKVHLENYILNPHIYFWVLFCIFKHIEGKSIEEPILTDRYFAENYPGNIVELDTINMERVTSYGLFYGVNIFDFYNKTSYYIEKTFTPEIKNKYEEFYNKIIEKANKK